jgi:long-chain acyl-CoA synthetase
MRSLEAVLTRGARQHASIAARDKSNAIGFDDLTRRVLQAARMLREQHITRLAVALDNSIEWAVVDLAAQRAGVPVIPLPPFFSATQVAHVLADSGADAVIADRTGANWVASLTTHSLLELSSQAGLYRIDRPDHITSLPAGTAKISYTSGTTGRPRGVCLPQIALDRVAESLFLATQHLGIERHLCLLPLATLLENVAGIYAPWMAGAEVVLPSLAETGLQGGAGIDVGRLIGCINKYEPGSIILLPQMLAAIVDAVESGAKLPLSLRFAAVGGGVVGASLLERADRAGIPAFEGYGLTECGSVVALNTPQARRIGSVGRPLAHCRVRIARDGEVCVEGAVMSGYLGQPDSSASYFARHKSDTASVTTADGIGVNGIGVNGTSANRAKAEIATGDIGRIDADGYLFIDGRKKSVLITSYGRNLSPEWVEAALVSTGSITQAVLFGDGMPFNVAVIVPQPDASISEIENDVGLVNRDLPDYARIRHWLLADESFTPRNGLATANGRLRRGEIEDRYMNEVAACYAGAIETCAGTG